MSKILIKNGTIINASGLTNADVLIDGEKIIKVAPCLTAPDNEYEIIDASGSYIIPGAIDPHVHMHLPSPAGYSSDDFYTGSVAALAGGTTTIIDFITPNRNQSLIEAYRLRMQETSLCQCDFSFHMSPVNWNKQVADEMTLCINELGITSFKTYMAYKSSIGIDDKTLFEIMKHIKSLNAILTVHAEDGDFVEQLRTKFRNNGQISAKFHALSRPPEVEESAISRVIQMAENTGVKLYIVHVSTGEGTKLIEEAKNKGLQVFGETCPQYLLLDESLLNNSFYDSAPYVLSPALRTKHHQDELWKGLKNGTLSTIGTDHCPFNLYGQKDMGKNDFTLIPNGAGGVEHRLELLYTYGVLTNKLSLEKWVELTSYGPAQLFNLTNKGEIDDGFDADIVIWNPQIERKISHLIHHQHCDSNIYEGFTINGKAEKVILRGKLKWNHNQLCDKKPGQYIWRKVS